MKTIHEFVKEMKICLIIFMLIHLASAKYCRKTRVICLQVGKCQQDNCPVGYNHDCGYDICAKETSLCQILTQFQLSIDAIRSPYLKSVELNKSYE